MPEITDEELLAARRAVEIIQKLNANPESRADFQRSLKKLDPTIRTQEDEANELTAPLKAQIDAMRLLLEERDTKEAAEREQRVEEAAMQRLTDGFSRLRSQHGLTPEGEEKLKQIMTEKTIPDPEVAFAFFEKQNPKPLPEQPGWTPDRWNYDTDSVVDTAGLFKDSEKWGDDMVGQVLMEERRRSGEDS